MMKYFTPTVSQLDEVVWDCVQPKSRDFLVWNNDKSRALIRCPSDAIPGFATSWQSFDQPTVRNWQNTPGNQWYKPPVE